MIGGAEDKKGEKVCLQTLARLSGTGSLVVLTIASEEPQQQWSTYFEIFSAMGVDDVHHVTAVHRDQFSSPAVLEVLERARAVFFTGGDQLKITTLLAGTPAYDVIRGLYKKRSGVVAGTSAGAAAMGQVMLMGATNGRPEVHKIRQAFMMARGLSLIRDVVIDQHFAQRARIERLLGAVAENPGVLGVGIDEGHGDRGRLSAFRSHRIGSGVRRGRKWHQLHQRDAARAGEHAEPARRSSACACRRLHLRHGKAAALLRGNP